MMSSAIRGDVLDMFLWSNFIDFLFLTEDDILVVQINTVLKYIQCMRMHQNIK